MKKTFSALRLTLGFLLCVCMLAMSGLPAFTRSAQAEGTAPFVPEDPPLRDLTRSHGFDLGAPLSYPQLKDAAYLHLVSTHFSTITCTNEMKAYSLLDQAASKRDPDGMPAMRFDQADKMVSWARENGLKVRGHNLVWDAYMTTWFFHEGYDDRKPLADRETMLKRMESYITRVMTHFETKFPGTVICWDVVNEAVGDSPAEYAAGDDLHLRTSRGGASNMFYDRVGDDYVAQAFLFARNAAEALGADIALYYNDYNAFQTDKRKAILKLCDSVNHFAQDETGADRKLVDGVGLQGYIGGYGVQSGCMNPADISAVKASIQAYADAGLMAQITEMSLRNYEKDQAWKHVDYYGNMFRMFMAVNSGDKPLLNNVSIWGLTDCNSLPASHYTWKLNSPWCGLVTERCEAKPELERVYGVLSGQAE